MGAPGRGRPGFAPRSPDHGRARAAQEPGARGARAPQGKRDPAGCERVFRQGTRSDPTEVSRFIDEYRGRFGVEFICETLGVSASAYYRRATGQRSARELADERLLARIREIHEANFEAYGYRRTWKALRRAGERVPCCQVQRLMHEHGIQGAKRRGKPWRTTIPDPNATRPADLVERDFSAEAPDRLWVCDLTRLRCWDGVVYFAFVIDVFSRRVVGWQLATHMRTTLVMDALRMALTQRRPGATSRSWSTPMPAASTRPTTTRRSSTITTYCNRSDRRRRAGQRHGRIVRGQLQSRA